MAADLFQGFPGLKPRKINKLSLVPAIPTLGKPCMGLGLVGYSGTLEIELGPGGTPRDSGA